MKLSTSGSASPALQNQPALCSAPVSAGRSSSRGISRPPGFRQPLAHAALILCGLCSSTALHAETLQEAVRLAVESHPQVLAARTNAQAASFQVTSAQTGMNAQFGVFAQPGYGYVRGGNRGASGDLGMQVTKPIYDGGRTEYEVNRQVSLLESGNLRVDAAQVDIALRTVDAYMESFKQRELVTLAEDYVQQITSLRDRTAEIVRLDRGRSYDLLQADSRLRTAQLQLETRRGAMQDALVQLAELVGRPVRELTLPTQPPLSEPGSLEQTLEQHPQLRAIRAEVRAAEEAAAKAAVWNRPILSVRAQVNSPEFPAGERKWFGGYNVGLVSDWNPFDGGAGAAGADAARAQVAAAEDQYLSQRRTLATQIATFRSQLENRNARVAAIGDMISGAERVRAAYWEQFQIGRRSMIDLLNAEAEAYQARVSNVSERFELLQVRYRLIGTEARLMPWLQIGYAPDVPVPSADTPPVMPQRRPLPELPNLP